jgi:hypothetical protein
MLSERQIELLWVERTVEAPEAVEQDRVDPRLEHCLRRIAERGDRVLRVIADRAGVPARVVTAFFDRDARVIT